MRMLRAVLFCLLAALPACTSGPSPEEQGLPPAGSPRELAEALRVRAIRYLEAGYRAVDDAKSRRLFDLAIVDLERARKTYFELLRELPPPLQAPVEGEIEQVQSLLRRAYSERPQLPIR